MTNAKFRAKRPVNITRAKILDQEGFEEIIRDVQQGEHALRNEALLRLSFYCGLRAQEIAGLQWKRHLLTPKGRVVSVLRVTRDIAKGDRARIVERDIPLDPTLIEVLTRLRITRPRDRFVIYALAEPRNYGDSGFQNRAEDGGVAPNTLVKYMIRLFGAAGFEGCTSHSGRRTFITNLARRCNEAGGSLVDVQKLAGHRDLNTTGGYIEPSQAQHQLVQMVF